jgi:hypothetical protein
LGQRAASNQALAAASSEKRLSLNMLVPIGLVLRSIRTGYTTETVLSTT